MTTSLTGALSSLQTSTALLSSTISTLDASISDLPRLSKVLAQRRHFELLPSSTLHAAQVAVVAELAPEVEALLARAEAYVEKLERRDQGLRAKWELQEGRLGREAQMGGGGYGSGSTGVRGKIDRGEGAGAARGKTLGPREELRAQQLRQKKERLSYAVERLQLQASQTERKLRMSMAAQEQHHTRAGHSRDDEDDDELA